MIAQPVTMAHGQGNAEIRHGQGPYLTCNHEAPIVCHGTQDPDISEDRVHALGRNSGQENAVCITGRVTYALNATNNGKGCSEDGTGRGVPTIAYQGETDANASEADASSVLSALREAVGKEAFKEWGLGVLAAFQSPEVLRSWLHGASLREQAENFRSFVDDCPLSRQKDGWAGPILREVWERGPNGRSPQGRGMATQLAGKPGEGLSVLPHEGTQKAECLHGVREASEGARLLRKALSEVEEVGRSTRSKGESKRWGYAVRRLTPREAERLQGFPDDHTLIPWRGKPAEQCPDGPRYTAIGNSWAVPVAHWLGERMEIVDRIISTETSA